MEKEAPAKGTLAYLVSGGGGGGERGSESTDERAADLEELVRPFAEKARAGMAPKDVMLQVCAQTVTKRAGI